MSLRFMKMKRFFLHIRDGATLLEDPEGTLLPNVEAACEEAIQSAREILASKVLAGEVVDGQTFEITDETGAMCATLAFKDAMRLAE